MASSWERLASVTLGNAGDSLDSGTFTAKSHLKVVVDAIASGAIETNFRVNGDTGSNYTYRKSTNGGSDSTNTGVSYADAHAGNTGNQYATSHIINIADKEKIMITDSVGTSTGASNAPDRREFIHKWANTSDQITRIEWRNVGSGSFATGSTITVFGADDQVSTDKSKDSITDVPTGSQFEETNTRKFYQRAGISNPLSQPSGLGDKVWDLTHASSYMTVDSDIVKTANDATISFWWRPASISASQGVIKHKSGGSTSDYSFLIEFSPSNMLRLYAVNSSNQSSDIRTNTGILTADTWYHIVLTWDTSAGDGQWYLNGSSITTNSNSTSGVNAPRSTDYQFGSTSQGGESLGGYVSDFAIYDTILPATGSNSIASLYNSGDGAKANTVATSNLRCYWSGKDGDESTIDNEATGASADTDADFDTVSNVSSAGKTPARWVERGTAI